MRRSIRGALWARHVAVDSSPQAPGNRHSLVPGLQGEGRQLELVAVEAERYELFAARAGGALECSDEEVSLASVDVGAYDAWHWTAVHGSVRRSAGSYRAYLHGEVVELQP